MCLNYTSIPLSRARKCWWGLKWAVQKKKNAFKGGQAKKYWAGGMEEGRQKVAFKFLQ